jgi:hypothetical protein
MFKGTGILSSSAVCSKAASGTAIDAMAMTPEQVDEAADLLEQLRDAKERLTYWDRVDGEMTGTDDRVTVLRRELEKRYQRDRDDPDDPNISDELIDKMFTVLRQTQMDEYAARIEALTKDLQDLGVKI